VKALAKGSFPAIHRQHERPRDIFGMHVVNGLHAKVWNADFFAIHQRGKHGKVEISLRVYGCPSWTDKMSRVKNGSRKIVFPRLLQQPVFDRRLANAIVAKGAARLIFRGWNYSTVPVDPDCATVKQVFHAASKRADELIGTRQVIARKVDYNFCAKPGDLFPKRAGLLFSHAIELKIRDRLPTRVLTIGLPRLTGDTSH
jgi:hypothetical protein